MVIAMSDTSAAGILSRFAETALLIIPRLKTGSVAEAQTNARELAALVDTMGLDVLDSMIVPLDAPKSRFFVGTGKADEIAEAADNLEVDCIIFDDDLSPSQQRNWEKLTDRCVIDRHEVILDIFAQRAHTREAALQVGLARLEYSLPRLTRAWTHLSRQRGGARGTRGEGETQLEVDRRIVLRKIAKFKSELKKVRANRATMRKQRLAVPLPTASIVGYTNAGKSSLLNTLTDAHILAENKLFATLDPTTKKLSLPGGQELLLTDTVGFIRKLPHDLVEAFLSTLEETTLAGFLIHVIDASDPEAEHHISVTNSVLKELDAADKEVLMVFNKTDLCTDELRLHLLKQDFPEAVFISAKTGDGLEQFSEKVELYLNRSHQIHQYFIPGNRYDLVALIHRTGNVLKEEHQDHGILIEARVPEKTEGILEEYLTD